MALQPIGDVHAITVNIISLCDYIAEVDADAELQLLVGRKARILLGFGLLNLDGATKRIDNTWELNEQPVAHRLDQTTMMFSDFGFDDFI